jgi:DNA-binding transcriptional MerR regulator
MKIGELAERTGLAPSKIRFYEAQGLIAPVQRQANGYREYLPQSVQLLEIIVTAQAGGFSLDEIRHLADGRHGEVGQGEIDRHLEAQGRGD